MASHMCRDCDDPKDKTPQCPHDDVAARRYWIERLADTDAPAFPAKMATEHEREMKGLDRTVPFSLNAGFEAVKLETMVELAWAVTVSQYTGSTDVVFGSVKNGRGASAAQAMTGPTMTTVPMRIILQSDKTVQETLSSMQQQSLEMSPYEQVGLQNINQWTSGAGCGFQNLLIIQSEDLDSKTFSIFNVKVGTSSDAGLGNYPLTLQCTPNGESLEFHALYDSSVVAELFMDRVMTQMVHNLNRLNESCDRLLSQINPLNPQDATQLQKWNATPHEPINSCIHDLIAEKIHEQTTSPAICAWDGNLTYAELGALSSSLAKQLIDRGVGPGQVIPVYFPRSMWTPVVVLAIAQTGAAFVLLERDHPADRLRDICQQVDAKLLICPRDDIAAASGFCPDIFPFHPSQLNPSSTTVLSRQVTPDALLYVAFTSGSTGRPKGAMITHSSFATLAIHLNRTSNRGAHTRRLALSSYAFDVSIGDMFFTLIGGGCICIPTNLDNLPKAIAELKANAFDSTNSVLRTLRPDECEGLESVLTTGESPTRDVLEAWTPKVRLIQVYGPTECSVWCATTTAMSDTSEPSIIGTPMGCRVWIVDPANPDHLMPVQGIGELVVDGPIVGAGYINNPEKTATTFIQKPAWLDGATSSRVYRTGDLVQYTSDGTLRFIGRKDRQVKLYGNRIELGEVEFQIQCAFSRPVSVVAELIKPAGPNSRPVLLAFICLTPNHKKLSATDTTAGLLEAGTDSFRTETASVRLRLRESLPPYMIPGVFLPVSYIPWTATGKTDRLRLRAAAEALDRHELGEAEAGTTTFRLPTTETEKTLHRLFVQVLSIPAESLSADAHFFHAGGDSVLAWRLVMAARNCGIVLTGDQILNHPVLSDLADLLDGYVKVKVEKEVVEKVVVKEVPVCDG